MAKTGSKPIEEMTYEEAFAELEKVVQALESGEQPLELSMSLFEHGLELTRRCSALLSEAELKVKTLVNGALEEFKEEE